MQKLGPFEIPIATTVAAGASACINSVAAAGGTQSSNATTDTQISLLNTKNLTAVPDDGEKNHLCEQVIHISSRAQTDFMDVPSHKPDLILFTDVSPCKDSNRLVYCGELGTGDRSKTTASKDECTSSRTRSFDDAAHIERGK